MNYNKPRELKSFLIYMVILWYFSVVCVCPCFLFKDVLSDLKTNIKESELKEVN